MKFYNSCTSWPPEDVEAEGGLCEMVANAMSISRRTFLKHVNRDDLSVLNGSWVVQAIQSGASL